MAVILSNTKSSPALKGQDVRVTLVSDVAIAYLPQMAKGNVCTNLDGGKTGTINYLNTRKQYFTVTPIAPNFSFDSASTPGFLSATQTISIAF